MILICLRFEASWHTSHPNRISTPKHIKTITRPITLYHLKKTHNDPRFHRADIIRNLPLFYSIIYLTLGIKSKWRSIQWQQFREFSVLGLFPFRTLKIAKRSFHQFHLDFQIRLIYDNMKFLTLPYPTYLEVFTLKSEEQQWSIDNPKNIQINPIEYQVN